MITKAERGELRSLVRQQFKVLRAEVIQRQAEMMAEVEETIGDRYRRHDEAYDEATQIVRDIVHEANTKAAAALKDANVPLVRLRGEAGNIIGAMLPQLDKSDRYNERNVAQSQIEAMVKGALLRLDREEADLLRSLAVGALESTEAQTFLGSIPQVGELVSMARLAELQKAIEQ
jgi:hypothetical protein